MQNKTLVVDDVPQTFEDPTAVVYLGIGISLALMLVAVLVKRLRKR